MVPTLCGATISSRRGLLASLWSLVIILSAISFLTTFIFALTARGGSGNSSSNYRSNNNNYGNNVGDQGSQDDGAYDFEPVVAVTSRALAFAALWTAVLAALMSVFGTVILGWQSPTGMYYTCCSSSVHRTTPLGLGSFIGALLMFANLTLICSILFGEFEVRDFRDAEGRNNGDNSNSYYSSGADERISMAFSVMCMFLTVLYAGFAALTFAFANAVIEECALDEREESMLSTRSKLPGHFHGFNGYIGERFDVGRSRNSGFVAPPPPEATLL